MRIVLIAVGRCRDPSINVLVADYARRCPWPIDTVEVVAKPNIPPARLREEEGRLLLAALPPDAAAVALDERGREMDSIAFANLLGGWRDGGRRAVALLIGGADGLSDQVRSRADIVLALGRMTWPHMLVRAMLAEQVYRAGTILAGHPYHRA